MGRLPGTNVVEEEEADDLLAMIESELRDRRFAPIVRLQVQPEMNPVHRGRLAAELGLHEVLPEAHVTVSSEVLPEFREYERTSTVCINAYVMPKVNEADLEDLPQEVRDKLTIHLVEELGEALAHTLRGGEFREGRLQFAGKTPKKGSSPDLQH